MIIKLWASVAEMCSPTTHACLIITNDFFFKKNRIELMQTNADFY